MLQPAGFLSLSSATTGTSPEPRPTYDVRLTFARGNRIMGSTLLAAASDLSAFGVEALIGRDVLARCLLVYNGPHDQFILSY